MSDLRETSEAGRVPLFDRLVDDDPHIGYEPIPYRTLDREGLHESVKHEVQRILFTRCQWPAETTLQTSQRTVLNYGLPDLTHRSESRIPEHRLRMVRLVQSTIEAFEPRLTDVHVELLDSAEGGSQLTVSLQANVMVEELREPISFTLSLGGRSP